MKTFKNIENIRRKRGAFAFALIDPDQKNDSKLNEIINKINLSDFDGVLVGGSLIMDNHFEHRITSIKNQTNLPVIIFPGSSNQLSSMADAILYLSLLSGRNPQYLIGEHVESAPTIYNLALETISTGYILLEGGIRSSVEIMSNTIPIPTDKKDIILAHALAGQYLGNQLIFFESGSGAQNCISDKLVSYVSSKLSIPLMIGGGIMNPKDATSLVSAGASYIVIGNILESNIVKEEIKKITKAIHINE